jgi:hypothetical protein
MHIDARVAARQRRKKQGPLPFIYLPEERREPGDGQRQQPRRRQAAAAVDGAAVEARAAEANANANADAGGEEGQGRRVRCSCCCFGGGRGGACGHGPTGEPEHTQGVSRAGSGGAGDAQRQARPVCGLGFDEGTLSERRVCVSVAWQQQQQNILSERSQARADMNTYRMMTKSDGCVWIFVMFVYVIKGFRFAHRSSRGRGSCVSVCDGWSERHSCSLSLFFFYHSPQERGTEDQDAPASSHHHRLATS